MSQSEAARLETLRQRLELLASKRVMTNQLAYVQNKRMELVHLQQRVGDLSGALVARKREKFSMLSASLDAMSPLKVLARGYAVATDADGAVLRSAAQTQPGDTIRVQLQDGALHCTVNNREGAHGKTETDL